MTNKKSFFSLSLEENHDNDVETSKPIARIVPFRNLLEYIDWIETKPKHRKKIRDEYIWLNQHSKPQSDLNLEISLDDKLVLPLMIRQECNYPNRVFIAGGTLCGKSTLASILSHDYNNCFPKNKIALVSCVENDQNYNNQRLKNVYPIKVSEDLIDDPIELEELHDSLSIFDDIQASGNRYLTATLEDLRDRALKAGRHHHTDVIVTSQTLLDGKRTKECLCNCFQIIGFPHSAGRYQLSQFLKRYMSMGNQDIERIINVPSRYVLINRTSPTFIIHDHGVFIA